MPFRRRRPRIDYPNTMPCLECKTEAYRHCLNVKQGDGTEKTNRQCNWYDCHVCHRRTYIIGEPEYRDGKRYWSCLSMHLWW